MYPKCGGPNSLDVTENAFLEDCLSDFKDVKYKLSKINCTAGSHSWIQVASSFTRLMLIQSVTTFPMSKLDHCFYPSKQQQLVSNLAAPILDLASTMAGSTGWDVASIADVISTGGTCLTDMRSFAEMHAP